MKTFTLLFLLCLISVWALPSDKLKKSLLRIKNPGVRIIGGSLAKPGQFPWEVAIFAETSDGAQFLCGGALIDVKWVLTSGHCVYNAISFTLVLGTTSIATDERYAVIVDAVHSELHPNYDPLTSQSDIGLIRIDEYLPLHEYIQIIHLSTSTTPGSIDVTVSGWGATSSEGSLSYNLKFVKLKTLTNEECRSADSYDILCAIGTINEGICRNDGGDPLIMFDKDGKPFHVGITRWVSAGECDTFSPSTYIRTSAYIQWIKHVITK